MFPSRGFLSGHAFSNRNALLVRGEVGKEAPDGGDLSATSGSKLSPLKSQESSKKHALAERQRRKRINRHFNTLRQLFPHLVKRDKPSILTETVRRLKELSRAVAEVAMHPDGDPHVGGSTSFLLPDANDEATVSYCEGTEGRMIKATISCEDRPCLSCDLSKAIQSIQGRLMAAEIAAVGGRAKVVAVVRRQQNDGAEDDVISLRRALKAVVENRALGFSGVLSHCLRPILKNQDGNGTLSNIGSGLDPALSTG